MNPTHYESISLTWNIKPVFNWFKIKNYFLYKDLTPNDLKSFLVNKFTCTSCSSSYIGETCRHSKTRIEKHIKKDSKSQIFKHLHSTSACFDSYNSLCFKKIDKANSKFDLKIKEGLHINWRKPNLNAQKNHLVSPNLTLLSPVFLFCLCFFCFYFCFILRFFFIYFSHCLWYWVSASFTALITFRYYY